MSLRYKLSIFFSLTFFSLAFSHTPGAFLKENKFLVNTSVLSIHLECDELSPYETQAVYGHPVYLVEVKENGWARVETEDGYQGFAQTKNLIKDDIRYRASNNLCKVSAVCGMVYSIADTEKPAILRLPFDSYIETLEDFDANANRFVEVKLLDGRDAYIQRGDLEKPFVRTLSEAMAISHKFSLSMR